MKYLGYIISGALVAISGVLWTQTPLFPYKFTDMSQTMTSIGQLSGIFGLVLFSLSMLLSLRFRWYEWLFPGMNQVYIAHHIIGGIGFILLLIHPLALSYAYITLSYKEGLSFFLPHLDWTITLGQVALLLFMTLLVLTYYVRLPYHIWRFTHKFLGVSFFLGGVHGLLTSSDVSLYQPLKGYMWTICVLAMVGYIYRTWLGRFFVRRTIYIVDGVRVLGDQITEITMRPKNRILQFQPGQFVYISFHGDGYSSETHPFSLSSAPDPGQIRLSVKSLGDYTKNLSQIKPGMVAKIEGPFGHFSYQRYNPTRQIWIAGGIGITPFLSMARTITSSTGPVDCFYAVKEEHEAVYLQELAEISGKFPQFQVLPVYSTIHGRLTADTIFSLSKDANNADYFLCGPPPMMSNLRAQLRAHSVPSSRIHSEEFSMR